MRFDRLRFLAALTAIALAVSGCIGNGEIPSSRPVQHNASVMAGSITANHDRGGAFVAQHVGTLRYVPCSPSKAGHFFFHGSGRAAYMHQNVENGALIVKPSGGHCVWSGIATMTSSRDRSDSITFTLSIKDGIRYNPCTSGARFVVKRGTGKFALANGSGAIFFACNGSDFTDSWNGTITF